MPSPTSAMACLWVGVTWQWAGWQQWLVYHLSPVKPERPYAQTEGGWASELWSCGQLLGPNCPTIWRWIVCVFWKKRWTLIARFTACYQEWISWLLILLEDCYTLDYGCGQTTHHTKQLYLKAQTVSKSTLVPNSSNTLKASVFDDTD